MVLLWCQVVIPEHSDSSLMGQALNLPLSLLDEIQQLHGLP